MNLLYRLYLRYPVAISIGYLVVVIGLIVVKQNVILNSISGPYPVTTAYISGLTNVDDSTPQTFVSFTGDKMIDTGFQWVYTTNGAESSRSNVLLAAVNNRFVVVTRPVENPKTDVHITGYLENLLPDEQSKVVTPFLAENPTFNGKILPIQVTETLYRGQQSIFFLLAIPGFVIVGLVGLGFGLRRELDPNKERTP